MRFRRLSTALVAVAALLVAACSSPTTSSPATTPSPGGTAGASAAGFPATIDTKFGAVTVTQKPTRVVALGWGDAEVALAFGVQPVGAADWLAFGGEGVGPWAKGLYTTPPEILGTMELSYEKIAALKPDLILDVRSSGDQERYNRLSSIATTVGVPTGGDSWVTTRDQQVTMISTALGQADAGKKLLAETDAAFAKAAAAHPAWAGKTVAVASRTSEGWYAYAKDSRVDFMTSLGFVQSPAIAELPNPSGSFSVNISPEQLDKLNADLLIAFPIFIDKTQITEDSGWKQIPAVADNRAIVVDGDLAQAFSLGTPAAQRYALEQFTPQIEAAVR